MTRSALTSIAAALGIALAGLAMAAPPSDSSTSGRSHGPMQKLDLNDDGVIERSEAAAHPRLAARFDQLDSNGDGRLDAGERPRWQGRHGRRGSDLPVTRHLSLVTAFLSTVHCNLAFPPRRVYTRHLNIPVIVRRPHTCQRTA